MDYRAFYRDLLDRLDKEPEITIRTALGGPEKGNKYLGNDGPDLGDCEHREVLSGKPGVVICGGGHVGSALCKILQMMEWEITVVDDRLAALSGERFPGASRMICMPFEDLGKMDFPQGTFFVVATRNHAGDYDCLEALLDKPFGYLGMMASAKKLQTGLDRLREKGFTEEQLGRIHAPIGLPIGGKLPEEIAISIAAELVQTLHRESRTYWDDHVASAIRMEPEAMVLATVIAREGEGPQGPGARMIVFCDQQAVGTIGGGSLEAAVIRRCAELCGTGEAFVEEFSGEDPACGGKLTVLMEGLA